MTRTLETGNWNWRKEQESLIFAAWWPHKGDGGFLWPRGAAPIASTSNLIKASLLGQDNFATAPLGECILWRAAKTCSSGGGLGFLRDLSVARPGAGARAYRPAVGNSLVDVVRFLDPQAVFALSCSCFFSQALPLGSRKLLGLGCCCDDDGDDLVDSAVPGCSCCAWPRLICLFWCSWMFSDVPTAPRRQQFARCWCFCSCLLIISQVVSSFGGWVVGRETESPILGNRFRFVSCVRARRSCASA